MELFAERHVQIRALTEHSTKDTKETNDTKDTKETKDTKGRKGSLTIEQALALVARLRTAGEQIVFTNGVFDLLHIGHLRYLQHARALGDALIVGVNSDRSVRANKGPARPITPEAERAEVLEALECVDGVVVFDEETPHDLIAALQPDVLVKGDDWAETAIVGREIVEGRGGTVVRVPIEPGRSTSAIIRKIRRTLC